MNQRKIKCVTFHMKNPQDKKLLQYIENQDMDFNELVKFHLYGWAFGSEKERSVPQGDLKEDIRNSGLPFG